ncbi:ATP-binding protein [Xylophilus ampelinus]|uniref:ATP-binding protein n=1 Tax=Xylophilus ampelinus TaxID=54067 RepID=UPI00216ACBE5|nr:ATP-binding protein [Xylophilus ampelinus]MCS4510023.1 ATP-binding protein [Xylophilus ampelinus]
MQSPSNTTVPSFPASFASGRVLRLQTRIGIALGTVIVGASVVLSAVLAGIAERRMVALSANNLDGLADQMARELSTGMDQFGREVASQADRSRYRSPTSTRASMRAALEDFQRDNPKYAYVSVIDADTGTVEAATGGIFEGGSVVGRPVFEEGKKGLFLGDVHKAVRLADLLPARSDGEPLRFLDVAAPIRDAEGRVVRVFGTHIGWEWTAQVRDSVLGPVAERQGVEIFLVDTESKVVLTATDTVPVGTAMASLVRTTGKAIRQTGSDGIDYLTTTASTRPHGSFAGFGWRVVVRQPFSATLDSVRTLQYGFLSGGMAIGLLAAALAWWLTGRLVMPLRRLADAVERAEPGQPWADSRINVHETGEVAAVKRAMARLADSARSSADASSTSVRQFQALARSLPQVVWQADVQGRLEYVNQEWIRAHRPEGDFALADLALRAHPDDRAAFEAAWAHSLATGENLACKCRLAQTEGGVPRWFDIRAHAVPGADGRTHRWVGTLFDIDEIASLAAATHRALEEEKGARAESDRLARLRDEFLATVSHELRSPLNAIAGWSEILTRKKTDDPMIVKASQSIRRNARQQASLIDDLMDMTAVMAGKMVIRHEPVDLAASAQNVFLSHIHAAQAKGVELVCRDASPVWVMGEMRRLEQVMSNLVGNAIKFTDAGGRVELAVCADEAAGQAVVRVRDTGRGIAADFLPHVFERMRQEDGSVTRRSGGLGLGLAIARGIVELHGGGIAAHSPGTGQGATVSARLPLADTAGPAGAASTTDDIAVAVGAELQGLRVLLVDDEADAREVAHVALAGFGAEVRAVGSAAEVLRILETERFDVLVSDIGMPEIDGLTLIRRIRALPYGTAERLPAVALTAFSMEKDVRAGKDAGFQGYVGKPISLGALYAAIVGVVRP